MLFSIVTDWVTDNSAAHPQFSTEVLEVIQGHLGAETITPATSGMLEVYSRRLWDVTLPSRGSLLCRTVKDGNLGPTTKYLIAAESVLMGLGRTYLILWNTSIHWKQQKLPSHTTAEFNFLPLPS